MEQPEGKEVSKTVSASGNDTPVPAASVARKYLPREIAFGKMRATVEGADIGRQEITREQLKKN